MVKTEKVHGYVFGSSASAPTRVPCGLSSLYIVATRNSEDITCARCRKVLSEAMPSVRHFSVSLAQSIVIDKARTAFSSDLRATSARDHMVEQIDRVKSTLESAMCDLERTRKDVLTDAYLFTAHSLMLDKALEAARVGAFVVNNVRTDSLVKYGVQFDAALQRVYDTAKAQDEADTAASLATQKSRGA